MKSNNKRIIETIIHNIRLFDSFDKVYLFGSILKNKTVFNDIDILLVFSKHTEKMLDDLKIIDSCLQRLCGLPIDLTVLSVDEEKDTDFLTKISSYLKIK